MKELIDKAERIVILTHMAPDGDAMGSALALWHWCNSQCTIHNSQCTMHNSQLKSVHVIVPNAFPAFLGWMPGAEEVKIYEKEASACDRLIAEADLFLCTDFNDPKRIGPMGEKMMASAAPKVLIDHHIKVRRDDVRCTKEGIKVQRDDVRCTTDLRRHERTKVACEKS